MINQTSVWQPQFGQPGLRQAQVGQSDSREARLLSPTWPISWHVFRQGLQAEPNSRLMKFVTALVLISALTCIYVWQASTISDINKATAALKAEAFELERTNVGLAIDVVRWNAPGYVEGEARRQGMTPDQQPIYVAVPELT